MEQSPIQSNREFIVSVNVYIVGIKKIYLSTVVFSIVLVYYTVCISINVLSTVY